MAPGIRFTPELGGFPFLVVGPQGLEPCLPD